jgi:hypothetical protein
MEPGIILFTDEHITEPLPHFPVLNTELISVTASPIDSNSIQLNINVQIRGAKIFRENPDTPTQQHTFLKLNPNNLSELLIEENSPIGVDINIVGEPDATSFTLQLEFQNTVGKIGGGAGQ